MTAHQFYPEGAQFMSDRVMPQQSKADWFRLLSADYATRATRITHGKANSMLLDMSQSWLRLAELQDRLAMKAARSSSVSDLPDED
jgi:hypothetical protein